MIKDALEQTSQPAGNKVEMESFVRSILF